MYLATSRALLSHRHLICQPLGPEMSELPLKPVHQVAAENVPSGAERQPRRPGPRHAAPETEDWSPPRYVQGKGASTPPVGSTPGDGAAEDGPNQPLLRPAPNALRLLAFAVDLLLVAIVSVPIATAVSGSILFVVATLVLVFVVYHTASVWLTGGKTIGKALCNLSVGHLDGSAPAHDLAGLIWAFGRASVGYLVVDVFGLGVLVALGNPQRRCLHDYVFRSQVVTQLSQTDPQPRNRLAAALDRLRRYSEERETTLDEVKKNNLFLVHIWKWLVKLTAGCLAWLLVIEGKWHSLVARLSGHAASSAPAKAMSAGKTIAVVSTTAIVTGAGVVAAGAAYLATSVVGDWGNPAGMRIERVGVDTHRGVRLDDYTGPKNGCLFPKGEVVERLHGRGSHLTGSELWSYRNNGQNCTYAWGPATFDLIGNNTLKICSTAPMGDHRHECTTWVRTPEH
jgi:uncharacterized RDD family membrane protein YckC